MAMDLSSFTNERHAGEKIKEVQNFNLDEKFTSDEPSKSGDVMSWVFMTHGKYVWGGLGR